MKAKGLKTTLQVLYSRYNLPKDSAIDLYNATNFLNEKFGDGCARYNFEMNQICIEFEGIKFNLSRRGKIWTSATNFSEEEILERVNKIGRHLNKFICDGDRKCHRKFPIEKFQT